MRGSSTSSSARSKLSSISVYLLIAILINIVFIQCNFWFKLFEWRRYVSTLIEWMQLEPEQEQQQQPQSPSDHHHHSMVAAPIHLGRFYTMPCFWFHIRHLFQWPLFISINLVQLFIQFVHLNGSACIAFGMVASGIATAEKATASAVAIKQPMQSIKITTPNASYLLNTELFIIENHVDCDKFNGIIANGSMHSDDAAHNNQQMIIQSKQTERQQQQQQPL